MQMFRSATLKLTAWYLGIIMIVSVVFSISIYQINFHEVEVRLGNLERSFGGITLLPTTTTTELSTQTTSSYRSDQLKEASSQMILALVYINLIILVAGGLGSYFLARRTLRPIEKAHDAQSRFTSDASHELRTPLAAIKAEIEVNLRDPALSIDDAKELLESNLEEVNKLIALSEMLLNLSRLDYDRLDRKPLDLAVIVPEALKRYRKDKKRITLTTRKRALVVGDKAAMTELVTILMDNAIKYSPANSPIEVKVFERMGRIGVTVCNDGVIAEKDMGRLFDRFYRGDQSRTNSSKNGYGLGLALAKNIADIHNGDILLTQKKGRVIVTAFVPVARAVSKKQ